MKSSPSCLDDAFVYSMGVDLKNHRVTFLQLDSHSLCENTPVQSTL